MQFRIDFRQILNDTRHFCQNDVNACRNDDRHGEAHVKDALTMFQDLGQGHDHDERDLVPEPIPHFPAADVVVLHGLGEAGEEVHDDHDADDAERRDFCIQFLAPNVRCAMREWRWSMCSSYRQPSL